MKKSALFICSIALTVLFFSACKKSEDDVTITTLQKVQAKWSPDKEYYHENYSGVDYRDTTYGVVGDYIDYRTDGKVYYKIGSYLDTASYSLLGDTKIITTWTNSGSTPYSDTADILVLDDHNFQTHVKEFDPAPDYYEYWDYLTK
jgi:hypothetical protein